MKKEQRRRHHAKQRARKQRYRAWEVENIAILDGLGLPRAARKRVYRLRHLAAPIVRRCFEPGMLRDLVSVEALHVRDAYVSTAGTEALPRLAELVGGEHVFAKEETDADL
jgi:hypothetical protein